MDEIKDAAKKVQSALTALGVVATVREMPTTTRTAKDAATAIGCAVGQIAKSLVFRGVETGRPILIIASGNNRVNERAMAGVVGEPIERAIPQFVRDATGYAIGGIPPVGHASPLATWMDEELFSFDSVWAAAGTPESVFEITPAELARISRARIVQL